MRDVHEGAVCEVKIFGVPSLLFGVSEGQASQNEQIPFNSLQDSEVLVYKVSGLHMKTLCLSFPEAPCTVLT